MTFTIETMIRYITYSLLVILCMVLLAIDTQAHKPSDSYLVLKIKGTDIEGQWDVALRDLEYALGLDENDDGEITWGEVHTHQCEIDAYVLSRLQVRSDGNYCTIKCTEHLIDYHSDGAYTVLRFIMDCQKDPCELELDYSLFFDLDPQHRGLLRLEYQHLTQTAIFSPDQRRKQFNFGNITFTRWHSFMDFGWEGIKHIWGGFDHILFLFALLLPSVLQPNTGRWQAISRFRPVFWNVLKIVTPFTIAHSITLSLAALDIVHLPSRLVESIIAASIILATLNNFYPFFKDHVWIIAFVFGLIHGFGFASALQDLGLARGTLLLALVGFNLGVESGQLAITATFLPIAYLASQTWFYRRIVFGVGSLLIVVLASLWLIERMFNFELLPL